MIFGKSGNDGSLIAGYYFTYRSNNGFINLDLVNTNGSAGRRVEGSTTISINTWYHVVATYDGSNTAAGIKLYVNGVRETESTIVDTDPGTITNNLDPAIGARRGDGGPSPLPMDGSIEEVAVWDVELTADEVAKIANSRVRGTPLLVSNSNLKGYWPLDDFGDNTALDTTADGYRDHSSTGSHAKGVDTDGDSLNIASEILSYPEQSIYASFSPASGPTIETLSFTIVSSCTITDTQTYVEDLPFTIVSSCTITDDKIFAEDLTVTIVSSCTLTDIQNYVDTSSFTIVSSCTIIEVIAGLTIETLSMTIVSSCTLTEVYSPQIESQTCTGIITITITDIQASTSEDLTCTIVGVISLGQESDTGFSEQAVPTASPWTERSVHSASTFMES